MKFRSLALFFLLPLFSIAQKGDLDILHYRFDLELNDANDSIYGTAEITAKVLKQNPSVFIDLVTYSVGSGKGMKVDSVTGPFIRGFVKSPENIRIILMADKYLAGDTFQCRIIYHGIPADGLIISKNKYNKRCFFADNWPNRAHHWIPCIDQPGDKASVEFGVTAPEHYQVIANGMQVEESNLSAHKKLTRYNETIELPTKVMVIGVADFAVNYAGNVGCVPVYSWVYPEEKMNGFYDYALAKNILAWMIDFVGPYPYGKLANVQSKTVFGGMENAGAIFYHENSVDGKRSEKYLYAHEIAHQWFGDMATEKSFPHLWLSEGFATYFTHLYAQTIEGDAAFRQRMREDREQIIDFVRVQPKPVVDSATPFLQLLNANSYQRGSWVLHMLRSQLGDDVFRQSVRTYYDTYKGKNAETRDLQAVFEKVSGKNLDSFFRQWLLRAEIPRLDITWKYNSGQQNITITVTQLQKGGPFSFPLTILISGAGSPQPVSTTINVSGKLAAESFVVSTSTLTTIDTVEFDPMVTLLYDGKSRKL